MTSYIPHRHTDNCLMQAVTHTASLQMCGCRQELAAQALLMFPQVSAKENKAQPACAHAHVLTLAPCATFSSTANEMGA